VSAKAVIIMKDEARHVRAVYKYEGLEEQELSFPMGARVRLLRRNIKFKKFDEEQWCEGAYDGRIGFFPSIFVEDETEEDEFDKTVTSAQGEGGAGQEEDDNNENMLGVSGSFSPQQQVPQ
jgi:hypothetical protein